MLEVGRKKRETSDRRYVKAKQPPVELKEPTAKEKSSKKVVARAVAGLAGPISKQILRTCNGLPFGHACSPGSPFPFPTQTLIEKLILLARSFPFSFLFFTSPQIYLPFNRAN